MDPIPGYSSIYTLLPVNEFVRPWIIANTNVAMTLSACAEWFALYALLSRKIKRPSGPVHWQCTANPSKFPVARLLQMGKEIWHTFHLILLVY
jgi:hypothetical protein